MDYFKFKESVNNRMSASGSGIARTKDELDVERHFLGTTVRLSDGTEGLVFSRGPKNESNFFLYNCHLCGVPNLPGERCLQTHIAGRKHQSKLQQTVIDAVSFRAPLVQKTKIQMNIAPGEPVPPGFENEVKPLAEIQPFIDTYKEGSLIGIEYTVELMSKDEREPTYVCLLCDKKGDPRTIFAHWASYNHRLKYLEKHYPSVVKELVPYRYNPEARNVMPRIVQIIAEAIEDHYGRLVPTVCDNAEFKRNRNKVLQDIVAEKHFDDKTGPTFVNVIDKRTIDDLIKNSKGSISINIDSSKKRDLSPSSNAKAPKRLKSESLSSIRKGRDSLDSISSDSGSELAYPVSRDRSKSPSYDSFGKKKQKPQSPAYRVIPRVQRSPPFEESRETKDKKPTLPTPRELSKQASEIAQERYKWEKYRCLLEIASKELEKVLKEHEKNPEKHPLYPDEWKKFWNRRYKELQAEKKDPNKHDFKPEWIVFWTKRMKELHEDEIENKKVEIKKKLGLPEDGEEKTDLLKKQYKIKAPAKTAEKPPQVIDISDDEESLSSHPKSKRTARSISRSLSPLSDDDFDKKVSKKLLISSHYNREPPPEHITSRERYPVPGPDYYHHTSRDWPRSYYTPTTSHSHYGGYRTMDPYNYPQYEPPKKKQEEKEIDDGPLTVVAVLRLLTALEDHLGSLGPKVVDLLAKALALEKVKANSSDDMLLNEDNSVFFETVKEKLKGQLIADVLDSNKVKAVKKAIKNIAALIHQVNEKSNKKEETIENSEQDEKNSKKTKTAATKDLPFDRQLIASKLAAALVMQERTDISTEDMDKLIHCFILMVKSSKERGETVHVKDMLIELGIIAPEESFEEQIHEEIEKEISVDIFDINDEQEETAPQSAAGALESLTDSDLQTLLQNFKHLSSEEQHHLIAHLKKLESTDPVRVEKLRKFVDISNLKEEPGKISKSPNKSDSKDSPSKKPTTTTTATTLYSDDEDEKLQKMIDSDDDDYNFEDVVRIASNNVRDQRSSNDEKQRRLDSITRERDEDTSNMSRASSSSIANLNISIADTQNLIANLMGSLQKNSVNFSQNNNPKTSGESNTSSNIPIIISRSTNNAQNANASLKSQQSNQQMPPFMQQKQQQKQMSNMNPNNGANSNFMQDNFNMGNNIGYNPQNPESNFNTYNPFTNFPQQKQMQQPPAMQQTQQILQDFILQQQSFRAQRHQTGGNF